MDQVAHEAQGSRFGRRAVRQAHRYAIDHVPGHSQNGVQVQIDLALKAVVAQILEGTQRIRYVRRHARVAHQNVDGAECLLGFDNSR